MIRCPKCSFVQPEDQFCASCGIDMVNYKPAAPPLVVRPFRFWSVQLVVVLGLLFALFSYFEVPQQTFEEGLKVIRKVTQHKPTENVQSSDLIETAESVAGDTTTPSTAPTANVVNETALSSVATPNSDTQSFQVSARFIRTDSRTIENLLRRIRAEAQGDFAKFDPIQDPELSKVLQGSSVVISRMPGGKVITNDKLELNQGVRDAESKFHGVKMSITNIGVSPQYATVEIRWTRVWSDSPDSEHVYSENIRRGGGVIARHILPNEHTLSDELKTLFKTDSLLRYLPGVADEKTASDGAKRNTEVLALIDIQ